MGADQLGHQLVILYTLYGIFGDNMKITKEMVTRGWHEIDECIHCKHQFVNGEWATKVCPTCGYKGDYMSDICKKTVIRTWTKYLLGFIPLSDRYEYSNNKSKASI